jgi:hypothetical protein
MSLISAISISLDSTFKEHCQNRIQLGGEEGDLRLVILIPRSKTVSPLSIQ